jgi:hypothetical protein
VATLCLVPDEADAREGDDSRRPSGLDPALRYQDPLAKVAIRLGPAGAFAFGLLVYGVLEKLVLPMASGYFHLGGHPSTWRPDIEALVNGFVFVPTIFAAYIWQIDGVRKVLAGFLRPESFSDEEAFDEFVAKVTKWFHRERWWLLAVVVAIGGTLVQGLWLWNPDNPVPVPPWWEEGEPLSRVVALCLAPLLWYVAAQIVIGELRLAWTLRLQWQQLGRSFRAGSGQDDAGVAALSRHIGILTTIGTIVLLNLIIGALLPQLRATAASPDVTQWLVIIWTAYLIVVPGITLALIWPAHTAMSRAKDERIGAITARVMAELALAESSVEADTSIAPRLERIEETRNLRALLHKELARWPLPNPVRSVSWSAVVPLSLSVLTTVLDQFA